MRLVDNPEVVRLQFGGQTSDASASPAVAPEEPVATPPPSDLTPDPSDLFQGFTVIVADDPDAWARTVGERVGARVISSPFEAEQVVAHRAHAAEARQLRHRAAEAKRLSDLLERAPGIDSLPSSAPPPPPAFDVSLPTEYRVSSPPPPGLPSDTPAAAPPNYLAAGGPSFDTGGPSFGQATYDFPAAHTSEAVARVQRLAESLAEARQLEEAARARLAETALEADAARRLQASLEAAPTQLREAADAVLTTGEQARVLSEALGPRPVYDPEVHEKINELQDDHDDAADHYNFLRQRLKPLAVVAVGLVLVGISMRLSVAALVAIGLALLLGLGLLVRRLLAVRRRSSAGRDAMAAALAEAGVERADQLEQRKIESEAWQRRAKEAQAADDAWQHASQQWQAMAGPEASPDAVDQLIADLERARQVHEHLTTTRSAHTVAGEGVGRIEDDWRRLMAELGLDVAPSDPERAIGVLHQRHAAEAARRAAAEAADAARAEAARAEAARADAARAQAMPVSPSSLSPSSLFPSSPSPAGPASDGLPAGFDEQQARARLQELLEGETLEKLLDSVEKLGPDKEFDERPILLADPLRNVGGNRKRALLADFERQSRRAPVVLVTADPEVQQWAANR